MRLFFLFFCFIFVAVAEKDPNDAFFAQLDGYLANDIGNGESFAKTLCVKNFPNVASKMDVPYIQPLLVVLCRGKTDVNQEIFSGKSDDLSALKNQYMKYTEGSLKNVIQKLKGWRAYQSYFSGF